MARYVELNIGAFHEKRIASLARLKLKDVLKRRKPYMVPIASSSCALRRCCSKALRHSSWQVAW